eukprot:6205733-Amphidinium_carterae.1
MGAKSISSPVFGDDDDDDDDDDVDDDDGGGDDDDGDDDDDEEVRRKKHAQVRSLVHRCWVPQGMTDKPEKMRDC